MTDKELRKLKRIDLLELLVAQGREIETLRAELKKAMEALDDKRILIYQCGSIAEAAVKINQVFEAAQAAADQYLESIMAIEGGESVAGRMAGRTELHEAGDRGDTEK